MRNAAPEAREALPAVLPIVLYNGTPRWRAPQEIGSSIEHVMPAGEELPAMNSLEELRMTLQERLKGWPEQWMREGREQGIEQGLEHERALLCRMAALRFGAETRERLAALLATIADPDQLADIGDRLVQCRAADEFLAQVDLATR